MKRWALAFLAALAVVGCATRARVRPSVPAMTVPSASELLDSLTARRTSLRGIRALARTSYASPEESRRVKQLLIAARPDRLRFEFLSPFGVALVLTTLHGRLAVYAQGEHTVYRGPATVDNLRDFVQVELPVDSAVDVLLVSPPMLDARPGTVSRDEIGTKLWQSDESDVRVLWFDELLNPVRYERRAPDGSVLLRVTYDDYSDHDGMAVPRRISLELPPSQRSVTIELRDLEVNPALADAVFALETPTGTREVSLDQEPR